MSFADFDLFVDEHPELERDLPAAFAQWLADQSGRAIIGGPIGEAPTIVATPSKATP